MRAKKSFIFHNESDQERKVVQSLLKTLEDTRNTVTANLLEDSIGIDSASWGSDPQFEYRTEVTESNPQGEPRYLVAVSTDDMVLAGEPDEKSSRIDGRIRVYDTDGLQATVFIEAKIGSNPLQESQLRRYVNDFEITETSGEEPWRRIQWVDVYTMFQEINSQKDNDSPRSEWLANEYLLAEFSDWLRYTNQIQHRVGNGTVSDSHLKYLNVGVNQEDEYYIQLSAETHGERNQSGTATITESVWKRLIDKTDEEIRRETFGIPNDAESNPDPDLNTLRDWLLAEQGFRKQDFEGQGSRWVLEVDRPNHPLKIKFRHDDHLWIRTKPNVHYCPTLTPEEFNAVFDDINPAIREDVFINGDLEPLWKSTK